MDESLALNSLLSGAPPALPYPDRARWQLWQAQPGSFSIESFPGGIQTTDGGAGNVSNSLGDATHGPNFEIQVPGGFRTYNSEQFLNPARNCMCQGVYQYRWDVIAADANMYQGMSDTASDFITGNCITMLVRKAAGIDPPTFQLVTAVAGVVTNRVISGMPVVQNKRYKWNIIVSNGFATLLIDGVPVATARGGLPSAILGLGWELGGFTGAGSTFMKFEYLYGECSTF